MRQTCTLAPTGWRCSRDAGHEPPCAAWPVPASTPTGDFAARITRGQDRFSEVSASTQEQIDEVLLKDTHPAILNATLAVVIAHLALRMVLILFFATVLLRGAGWAGPTALFWSSAYVVVALSLTEYRGVKNVLRIVTKKDKQT